MRLDDIRINKLWSSADGAVVNTTVVGTNISHYRNSLNPGCKHIFSWMNSLSLAVLKFIIFNQLRKCAVTAGFHIFDDF